MKVIVLTADANTLLYHRGDLIRDMAASGCEVVTSAAEDYAHVQKFMSDLGGRHEPVRMVRSRVNLIRDRETWLDLVRLFRREKPDALFAYTIKSVLYGCPIARLVGVPKVYALLPGLGFTFVKQTTLKGRLLQFVSKILHRVALRRADVIFMQNEDDRRLFTELNLLPAGVPVHVTAGSGVNTDEFPHVALERDAELAVGGPLRFVLVSRLLLSKGVAVYAEAARKVKAEFPEAEFHLVGPLDPNPNRVEESQVEGWVKEGLLVHHGMVRDVAAILKKMHVFVLPTWYREGVPHATLEALSMGRVIITTDSVGARECVRLTKEGEAEREAGEELMIGENGFLTRPQSVEAVAQAMRICLRDRAQVMSMGQASRRLAEEVFDVKLVNDIILRAMGLRGSNPERASSMPAPATSTRTLAHPLPHGS
jgi:glycosyltransferase involved in cell wall biosynthesis